MPNDDTQFSFNISLSVLNHLGRNLYRSFITVVGEAISNAWDADAKNVWIYINREENYFVIKDDGLGMSKADFQNKFLKVGYSKREEDNFKSPNGRPYIGRKGIGKLALLSCAEKISVASKTITSTDYVTGKINNSELTQKITEDSTEYLLEQTDLDVFQDYILGDSQGTIIHFGDINEGIKNRLDYLRKIIALYFRFSLVDSSFNIFLNKEPITVALLKSLAENTEFIWNINTFEDPYIGELTKLKENGSFVVPNTNFKGFIASVVLPRHLKVFNSDEKIGIDLFVNGRLREKSILKHMPAFSTRHVASYLYGQIHFDELDDKVDRFTSSRESVISGDKKYTTLLNTLKTEVLENISSEWDSWRLKHKEDGDPENTEKITRKERKARELVTETFKEYVPPSTSSNRDQVDEWVNELEEDAQFNVTSYADCFVSENLIRKYVANKQIPLNTKAEREVEKWKKAEVIAKNKGNISIDIMENSDDLSYLSMDDLANLFDKQNDPRLASLARDAMEYKPLRNAVAHTARLTQIAKDRLNLVYENIKGRLRALLAGNSENT